MVIRIEQGKGRKDHYTALSEQFLYELRAYWIEYFSCLCSTIRLGSGYVLEILLEPEEVRQSRSRYTTGRKKGVEIHGQGEGRVRRAQVLYWSI